MRDKTPSYSSPKNSSRACLCKDTNTYSRKCCDGSLSAQGLGSLVGHKDAIISQIHKSFNNDFDKSFAI